MSTQLLDMWRNKIHESTEMFESLGANMAMEPVAPGKNRVIYLLGHLLVIHDAIFDSLELGKRRYAHYDVLFLTPQHPANAYPPFGLLLQEWIVLNEDLTRQLSSLSHSQWQSKLHYVSEADFILKPYKNRFCGFQCLITHLYHHSGQMELIRT